MRHSRKTFKLTAVNITVAFCMLAFILSTIGLSFGASEAQTVDGETQPVDDNMHHFMEYIFEPNYNRLRTSMANEPQDKKAWKAIKGDALTLAECANLLMARGPEEEADAWRRLSVAVRTHGGELYQAARKSEYRSARKAYETMLKNCNACHQQFAEGEYQLEP